MGGVVSRGLNRAHWPRPTSAVDNGTGRGSIPDAATDLAGSAIFHARRARPAGYGPAIGATQGCDA